MLAPEPWHAGCLLRCQTGTHRSRLRLRFAEARHRSGRSADHLRDHTEKLTQNPDDANGKAAKADSNVVALFQSQQHNRVLCGQFLAWLGRCVTYPPTFASSGIGRGFHGRAQSDLQTASNAISVPAQRRDQRRVALAPATRLQASHCRRHGAHPCRDLGLGQTGSMASANSSSRRANSSA